MKGPRFVTAFTHVSSYNPYKPAKVAHWLSKTIVYLSYHPFYGTFTFKDGLFLTLRYNINIYRKEYLCSMHAKSLWRILLLLNKKKRQTNKQATNKNARNNATWNAKASYGRRKRHSTWNQYIKLRIIFHLLIEIYVLYIYQSTTVIMSQNKNQKCSFYWK